MLSKIVQFADRGPGPNIPNLTFKKKDIVIALGIGIPIVLVTIPILFVYLAIRLPYYYGKELLDKIKRV